MKKKLLITLSIMILATCGVVNAKSKVTPELSQAINLYKQGNYSECYVKLNSILEKDNTNALVYYYYAMTNAQLGNTSGAIDSYQRVLSLAPANSNLGKFAAKGKRCLETPSECSDSLYSSAEEEFIRSIKGPKFSEPVSSQYEKYKLENKMREMNRINDGNPPDFNGFRDFSSMNNIPDSPSNDEIVAALRTLQQAGLAGTYGSADVSFLTGSNSQQQLMNLMGGSSMNPQLIQSLLTNNMSLGF